MVWCNNDINALICHVCLHLIGKSVSGTLKAMKLVPFSPGVRSGYCREIATMPQSASTNSCTFDEEVRYLRLLEGQQKNTSSTVPQGICGVCVGKGGGFIWNATGVVSKSSQRSLENTQLRLKRRSFWQQYHGAFPLCITHTFGNINLPVAFGIMHSDAENLETLLALKHHNLLWTCP